MCVQTTGALTHPPSPWFRVEGLGEKWEGRKKKVREKQSLFVMELIDLNSSMSGNA